MQDHDHAHESHGHSHGHAHVDFDSPEMVAHAEQEGEVLAGFVDRGAAALAEHAAAAGIAVSRVLDLGCGPGVGTCRLAPYFPSATLVAADGSAAMLERAAERAERLGLADRIETRLVELPEGLGTLGPADVVWASMVLHHIGDEAAALRQVRDLVVPGGLLALVEHGGPVRVLPAGGGTTGTLDGMWGRIDTAWQSWFEDMRAGLPGSTPSAGYPAMLAAAGFEVRTERPLTVTLDAPLDDAARRFAHRQFEFARAQLATHAHHDDLDALGRLLDERPEGEVRLRDDLHVRAIRLLYVAQRVAG